MNAPLPRVVKLAGNVISMREDELAIAISPIDFIPS